MDESIYEVERTDEDALLKRINSYNTIDLLTKVSCSSFFLKTDIFKEKYNQSYSIKFSKSVIFLSSLYITKGISNSMNIIGYDELLSLVDDIFNFVSIVSDDDEIESIVLSQNSVSEVLGKFKGYYMSSFLAFEEEILDECGVKCDDLVDDLRNYYSLTYGIKKEAKGITFECYINNFYKYDDSKFIYEGKYIDFLKNFSAHNGEYPEVYDFKNPLFSFEITRSCFLNINDNLYCFVPDMITGKLPKFFSKVVPDKLRNNWFNNRTDWSEESVKMLFNDWFVGAEIYTNNYFFPESKQKRNENDLLIFYKGYLFIVEIKAGSINPDSVYNNEKEVMDSYYSQIIEGNKQCNLVESVLKNKGSIDLYREDNSFKYRINYSNVEEIFKITVTFEEMGSFIPGFSIRNEIKNENYVVNFYNLWLIFDYLNNPALIIKYIQERKITLNKICMIHDELTYLGLYTNWCLNFSEIINNMVDEYNSNGKEIGTFFFPENEFMDNIELYYSNIGAVKPKFKISFLLCKILNANFSELTNYEMSHIVGLLNLPHETIEKIESGLTNPYNSVVITFCKRNSTKKYSLVIKRTKAECLSICSNYFVEHRDINMIVAIYFVGKKTFVETIKRDDLPKVGQNYISQKWNRTKYSNN